MEIARYLIQQGAKPRIIEGSRDDIYATAVAHHLFAEYQAQNNMSGISNHLSIAVEYYEKASLYYKSISGVVRSSAQHHATDSIIIIGLSMAQARLQAEGMARSQANVSKSGEGYGVGVAVLPDQKTSTLEKTYTDLNEKSNVCTQRAMLCKQAQELYGKENNGQQLYEYLKNIF